MNKTPKTPPDIQKAIETLRDLAPTDHVLNLNACSYTPTGEVKDGCTIFVVKSLVVLTIFSRIIESMQHSNIPMSGADLAQLRKTEQILKGFRAFAENPSSEAP